MNKEVDEQKKKKLFCEEFLMIINGIDNEILLKHMFNHCNI